MWSYVSEHTQPPLLHGETTSIGTRTPRPYTPGTKPWPPGYSSPSVDTVDSPWSRDAGEKIYVQDRMRQTGADLWKWFEAGAHFYICGDAKRMAKDVERALVDIAAEHGGMTAENAVAWVAALKKAQRFQADVY